MATWLKKTQAQIELAPDSTQVLRASGDWTIQQAAWLLHLLEKKYADIQDIDALNISRLDATGSHLLQKLLNTLKLSPEHLQLKPEHRALHEAVLAAAETPMLIKQSAPLIIRILHATGFWVDNAYKNSVLFLDFLGRSLMSLFATSIRPSRWRVTATVFHMQAVGLNAVPLVMLLCFMVGSVVAFLGATVLSAFGAEVYVVELVGVAFMREFGVLLTAILLAGRTASAFTAQLGSMKSGEEIDAIRTMGLDPIELLVLPRLKALLLTLPLLSFLATMSGLLGGMAIAYWHLGISPEMFIHRLNSELSARHFWIGMSKAPLFAVVIGLIGCLEGFKVKGSAQSVGEHTTSSVVQCISLVIILDALAALFFMELDL